MELYVSVAREDGNFERRYDYRPEQAWRKPGKKVCDKRLLAMAEKLKTPEGKVIYKRRQQSVEPATGIIKGAMGFRQFMLRGIEKVSGEWELICVAHNMKRLWNLKMAVT